MSFTHVVTEKVAIGGASISNAKTLTAGQKLSIEESIPVGNNILIAMAVDVSQIRSCYILADGALLLETNDSGSPAQTLTLAAGIPYIWYTGKDHALKFTTDITALYVTNATAGEVNLQMELLIDPTV